MFNIIMSLFVIAFMVYLINFPIYKKVKRLILNKRNKQSLMMAHGLNRYTKRYQLSTGYIENSIPNPNLSSEKVIKALTLIDDMHFQLKMYGFYMADKNCTFLFADCVVIEHDGDETKVKLYKIELSPVETQS